MRILIWSVVLIAFFMFIVNESNMIETSRVDEVKDGIEYKVMKYSIHWQKLFNYIKNIPRYMYYNLSYKLPKLLKGE